MSAPGLPGTSVPTDERTGLAAGVDHILGGVAHEIRNALFATGMTLEALEVSEPNAAELSGFIDALRRQLEPLHALVADLGLLDEPPTSGFAPASFTTLLRAAAERCHGTGKSDGARVVIADASMTNARVHVEQSSMLRALTHLISYALHRSAAGFTVSPVVRDIGADGDRQLECIIDDNGSPLRDEDLERLLDAYRPRSRGGFELRLASARRVIEVHGGAIHAEAAPVTGVRFVLRLPCAGATGGPARVPQR